MHASTESLSGEGIFYRKWKDMQVASVNLAVFEDICNTGTVSTDVALQRKKQQKQFLKLKIFFALIYIARVICYKLTA
jgi:hypothetical protein